MMMLMILPGVRPDEKACWRGRWVNSVLVCFCRLFDWQWQLVSVGVGLSCVWLGAGIEFLVGGIHCANFLTFLLGHLLTFLTFILALSFWQTFWHSIWHMFWHSFWHIFWVTISRILSDMSSDILSDIFLAYLLTYLVTVILAVFLTYLLAYLLTFLLAYLLTFILAYLVTFILAFLLLYLLTFPLAHLLTFFLSFFSAYLLVYLLTYCLTYFLTYLLTFFLAFFWHIFWHIFWHFFWLLTFFLAFVLAVEVPRCPLRWEGPLVEGFRSGSLSWGPALPTPIAVPVDVQDCPLRSGAPGWGPVLPTAMQSWQRGQGRKEEGEEAGDALLWNLTALTWQAGKNGKTKKRGTLAGIRRNQKIMMEWNLSVGTGENPVHSLGAVRENDTPDDSHRQGRQNGKLAKDLRTLTACCDRTRKCSEGAMGAICVWFLGFCEAGWSEGVRIYGLRAAAREGHVFWRSLRLLQTGEKHRKTVYCMLDSGTVHLWDVLEWMVA